MGHCSRGTKGVVWYWWTERLVSYRVKGHQGKNERARGYVILSHLPSWPSLKKSKKKEHRLGLRSILDGPLGWLHPRHIQGQTCPGPKINLFGPIRTFELRLKVI